MEKLGNIRLTCKTKIRPRDLNWCEWEIENVVMLYAYKCRFMQ